MLVALIPIIRVSGAAEKDRYCIVCRHVKILRHLGKVLKGGGVMVTDLLCGDVLTGFYGVVLRVCGFWVNISCSSEP